MIRLILFNNLHHYIAGNGLIVITFYGGNILYQAINQSNKTSIAPISSYIAYILIAYSLYPYIHSFIFFLVHKCDMKTPRVDCVTGWYTEPTGGWSRRRSDAGSSEQTIKRRILQTFHLTSDHSFSEARWEKWSSTHHSHVRGKPEQFSPFNAE